ncbi:MAG: SemiSWEET family transporter [Spirochaetia bacterium]|jgi:hypothetical protein|nr:SemiSWEET family transporter [Spirochaetia bacterium]
MTHAAKQIRLEKIIGMTGTVLTTLMFSSMIEVAWNNYMDLTKIWIQPSLTIISNSVWFSYGLLRKDIFLLIANGAGIVFAIITITAIFM